MPYARVLGPFPTERVVAWSVEDGIRSVVSGEDGGVVWWRFGGGVLVVAFWWWRCVGPK